MPRTEAIHNARAAPLTPIGERVLNGFSKGAANARRSGRQRGRWHFHCQTTGCGISGSPMTAASSTCSFCTPQDRLGTPICAIAMPGLDTPPRRSEDRGSSMDGAFEAGPADSFDGSATWTGSVVRGGDGVGGCSTPAPRFPSATAATNIETVGLATSTDLWSWTKQPGPIADRGRALVRNTRNLELARRSLARSVGLRDPDGEGWHMLITARANHGEDAGRGVIGHAVSPDLVDWQARPPLSAPQSRLRPSRGAATCRASTGTVFALLLQ